MNKYILPLVAGYVSVAALAFIVVVPYWFNPTTAALHEAFPDAYETFLEENASNISTGLRQKFAIARALIRNPRILILDDAISGFDIDSEIKLYDALPDIALGRTVIIVSNRLYHLRLCNKVFVLEINLKLRSSLSIIFPENPTIQLKGSLEVKPKFIDIMQP